jgi:hypothetical protein
VPAPSCRRHRIAIAATLAAVAAAALACADRAAHLAAPLPRGELRVLPTAPHSLAAEIPDALAAA